MKLPHSLRIIIFLLRLALGLNFLYLGLSTVFWSDVREQLGGRSFGDLYAWLAGVSNASSLQTIFAWAFLLIGACLIIGLIVRLASIAGIALVITSIVPNLSYQHLGIGQFVNDGVIAIVCLLLLFVANAGTYLGADQFFHVRLSSKHPT
jgi:uncharacterized membrane protein YphA (DoxX/SURF4 family)